MTDFFTGDTHFLHRGIMRYNVRPGADEEEMTEILIANWNAVVGVDDTVYHLGDFAFGPWRRWMEIFLRLHGRRKVLIRGNHDKNKHVLELGWDEIADLKTYKADKRSAVLCHYPMLTWDNAHHGRWMLHGHTHGNLTDHNPTRMDVGVDTHPEFRPYAWEEIVSRLDGQEYRIVDHHDGRRP